MASRQLPRGTGFRATLTAISAALIAALFVLSLAAFITPQTAGGNPAASNDVALLEPAAEAIHHTRALPLHSDAAQLKDVVIGGQVNPDAMVLKLMELARPFDLEAWIWYAATESYDLALPREGNWGFGRIPYSHPELEWSLEYNLSTLSRADSDAVLDFTAALIVAEAGLQEVNLGLVLAQIFLQRYAAFDQSCDVQLQLLYAYSLGYDPVLSDVEQVARQTAAACPDDPTPHWLMAQLASRLALDDWSFSNPGEAVALAEQHYAALREQFPDSPLGYAGLADFLMDRAQEVRNRGLRPFQARAWEQEALALYAQARAISEDPQLLIGQARALTTLGQLDAAADMVAQFPPGLATSPGASVMAVRQAQAAGSLTNVVAAIAAAGAPDPLRISPNEPFRIRGMERLIATEARLIDASYIAIGGPEVIDVAFIPTSREQYLSDGCFDEDLLHVGMLQGGDFAAWYSHIDALPDPLRCLSPLTVPEDRSTSYDERQDLQRWAGDLDGAKATIEEWGQGFPQDFAVPQRRGEVAYLAGDFNEAAMHFNDAWKLLQAQLDPSDPYPVYETLAGIFWDAVQPPVLLPLQLAAAQSAAGDRAGALESLHAAGEAYSDQSENHDAERFYVLAQLGTWYFEEGDYENAAAHYTEALIHGTLDETTLAEFPGMLSHSGDPHITLLRGAQENNLALALSQLERHDEAITLATSALSRDTASPLFLDTLAYTLQRAGRISEAMESYRDVLSRDATSYVSANNLAVLLSDGGEHEQARELLRGALNANPDYAIGWHNLGVVSARISPLQLISSEQALAKAARVDGTMRGEAPQLILDEAIYSSGLDISKALPPEWSFTATAQAPDRFTWTMLVLLVLQLGRAFGLEQVVTAAAQRIARGTASRLGPRRWLQIPVGLALTAGAVVLGLYASLGAGSVARSVLYGAAAAALVILPWGVRALMGKSGLHHYGSTPALGLGAVGLVLGLTIAPVPGVAPRAGRRVSTRVLWSAAALVGALGLIFAVLSGTSGSPTARFLTASAVALLGAMMLPFRPFDGAWQRNRAISLAVVIGLAVVSIALGLYWI